jgi:hypothetical protein
LTPAFVPQANVVALKALSGSGSALSGHPERATMNTANLQLEGVYAVLAALLHALRDEAIMSDAEIDHMLAEVERDIASDTERPVEVRSSNIDAMCFPVRFLRTSLRASAQGQRPSFAQVAAQIKQLRPK